MGRLATGGMRTDVAYRIYANPRLVRFTDQEVHEANHGRLIGEVARVGERVGGHIGGRRDLRVEVLHQLEHRLRCREGAADAIEQSVPRDRY